MSMENAKRLAADLFSGKISLEECKGDPAAFLEASGYDCTVEELDEAITMALPLDEDELDAVSGGFYPHCNSSSIWKKVKWAGKELGDGVKSLF